MCKNDQTRIIDDLGRVWEGDQEKASDRASIFMVNIESLKCFCCFVNKMKVLYCEVQNMLKINNTSSEFV